MSGRARRTAKDTNRDVSGGGAKSALGSLGPVWLTAIAALITALAGAAVLLQQAPAADVTDPRVSITGHRLEASTLGVEGSFSGLDADSETVVVLLRPKTTDATWAIQEGTLSPEGGATGGWEADFPIMQEGVFEVTAVIAPARRGGGFESSILDRLRDEGGDADIVRARSETVNVPTATPTSN